MSNSLPVGVVRIHFDTTSRFSARLAAQIIDAMAASIERNTDLGSETTTALTSTGEGTWWAQIAIIVGTVTAGAGAVVLAAQSLAAELKEGRTPFGRAVPAALDEGNGRVATICADDLEIRITVDQMLSYPPPVGEDRTFWVNNRSHSEVIDVDESSRNGNVRASNMGDTEIVSNIMQEAQRERIVFRTLTFAYEDESFEQVKNSEVIMPVDYREIDSSFFEGTLRIYSDQIKLESSGQTWLIKGVKFPMNGYDGKLVRIAGKHKSGDDKLYPRDITTISRGD